MTRRTDQQNKALHVYLERVAEHMADSGLDMKRVIRVPIRPTKENVKELMFKAVMTHLYPDVKSTTDLSTTQMQDCYEQFNAITSEKFGFGFDWPSEDSRSEDRE